MKCFYHKADLDGYCSGALIKMRYPNCEMIGINYGDEFPWDSINDIGETVWMVDFTLQLFDQMIQLNEKCDLIWIDHHKTKIEEHDKYIAGVRHLYQGIHVSKEIEKFIIQGVRDTRYAACELCYKYLYHPKSDEDIPYFVRLLGRYDIWDLDWDKNVLPFQMGMRTLSTDPCNEMVMKHIWEALIDDENNKCEFLIKIINDGEVILRYQEQQDKKVFEEDYIKHNLLAEKTALDRMLANCADSSVIDRMSLEARKAEVEKLLASETKGEE